MEQVSLPTEQDGEEEGNQHDHGPDHRDPSARDEGIEDDAGDRQPSGQFFDRNGEKKEFGTL